MIVPTAPVAPTTPMRGLASQARTPRARAERPCRRRVEGTWQAILIGEVETIDASIPACLERGEGLRGDAGVALHPGADEADLAEVVARRPARRRARRACGRRRRDPRPGRRRRSRRSSARSCRRSRRPRRARRRAARPSCPRRGRRSPRAGARRRRSVPFRASLHPPAGSTCRLLLRRTNGRGAAHCDYARPRSSAWPSRRRPRTPSRASRRS